MASTQSGGDNAGNSIKPTPGLCTFFVKRKHRFCKLTPVTGRKFCGQHLTAEGSMKGESSSSEDTTNGKPFKKRIPCPLDPKHSVYADQLKKHLKKCNAREKEQPVYHVKGINRIAAEDTTVKNQGSLSSLSKEELLQLIDSVQSVYKAKSVDIPSQVLSHDVLQGELSNPMNGTSARKHLCQVASLLGQLQHLNLLGSDTCFVEFGAGRGQMSHWVQQAVKDQSNVSFILVDRAHVRHKMDTPHRFQKDGPSYERLKIDIEHLCLGKVPSISNNSTPLVTYSKHLCGAATDLTLHCLMETLHTQQETNQDSPTAKLPHSHVSGIVIALCCHHMCDWTSYVGRNWWLAQGLTAKDFMKVSHMSSWATCGTKQKVPKKRVEKSLEEKKQSGDLQGDKNGKLTEEQSATDTQEKQSAIDKKDENLISSSNATSPKLIQESKDVKIQVSSDHGNVTEKVESESVNRSKVSKTTRDSDVHSAGGDISAQRLVGLNIEEREDIGRQCKRLIDIGRMRYLEGLGLKPQLIYYIDNELSLENVALIAVPNNP